MKVWQRYLDNIRSEYKVGSHFCWRIKEKIQKKCILTTLSWPELDFEQQTPHMFSKSVFRKSPGKSSQLDGKRLEKEPEAELSLETERPNKWLEKGRSSISSSYCWK